MVEFLDKPLHEFVAPDAVALAERRTVAWADRLEIHGVAAQVNRIPKAAAAERGVEGMAEHDSGAGAAIGGELEALEGTRHERRRDDLDVNGRLRRKVGDLDDVRHAVER